MSPFKAELKTANNFASSSDAALSMRLAPVSAAQASPIWVLPLPRGPVNKSTGEGQLGQARIVFTAS